MKLRLITLSALVACSGLGAKPRFTVVFVIDQFAHHYVEKIKPFLSGGLKKLFSQGIVYENTHVPLAAPATAASHATIVTGALPKDHGIINNLWRSPDGKEVDASSDDTQESSVFGDQGLQSYGCSSRHMMVDSLADQLILNSDPFKTHVYALSIKDRAAAMMAGKGGRAIWLDSSTGKFTTSKAYFDELPTWVDDFNKKNPTISKKKIVWKPAQEKNHAAYAFPYAQNYEDAAIEERFGKIITFDSTDAKKSTRSFTMTPESVYHLFKLAQSYLKTNVTGATDTFVLFISVSTLDYVGHAFGPHARETIDIIYHIDRAIADFMKALEEKFEKKDILYLLTSDHGVAPKPCVSRALRYPSQALVEDNLTRTINKAASTKAGFENPVLAICDNQVYLKPEILKLQGAKKNFILTAIKKTLEENESIKKVWINEQLERESVEPLSIEAAFKNQLFTGRSGQFSIQTYPYHVLLHKKDAAGHVSPYDYDTHIPLCIYQRGLFEDELISKRVFSTQIAPTLAHILNVPRPSASTADMLPKIVDKETKSLKSE